MVIICLSNQLWDWPLWTNKRQVMSRMANLGHTVIFVDPPIRVQKLVKQVLQGKWSLKRLLTGVREITTEFGANSSVVNFSPVTIKYSEDPNLVGFNALRLSRARQALFLQSPRLVASEASVPWKERVVLWVYNPSMREYVNKIPHDVLVYDCVDDYPVMANYQRLGLSEKVKEWEDGLVKKANVVFASAPGLVTRLKSINQKTYFAPNAGNFELFSNTDRSKITKPRQLDGIKAPVIGFTGTIDEYKVDASLVAKAARVLPEFSFVLIGPKAETDKAPDLKELASLPNVHFLPEVTYEDQMPYYAWFDAFIIPYKLNKYTVGGCFPVKFFDALSAGLPTIVTHLPAYDSYKEVCYVADSPEEFAAFISQAVKEDSAEKRKQRQKIAQENSWDAKVTRMVGVINQI